MIVEDKYAFKAVDKKDFFVSLKKKKFFGKNESIEKKKLKFSELANKCDS